MNIPIDNNLYSYRFVYSYAYAEIDGVRVINSTGFNNPPAVTNVNATSGNHQFNLKSYGGGGFIELQKYAKTAQLGDKTVKLGEYVLLGSKLWKVLGNDYIIAVNSEGDKAWGSSNTSISWANTPIKQWLNTTFYDSLGTDKLLLQDTSWTIGNENNETSFTDVSKIALLSRSEYLNLQSVVFPSGGDGSYWWTRTYSSTQGPGGDGRIWIVLNNGTLNGMNYPPTYLEGIRPVAVYKPGLKVTTGDGSMGNPYVLSDNRPPVISLVTSDNQTLLPIKLSTRCKISNIIR
ncbi:DUF6273 domain-containing protein [Brevibacillus centrosporus]|uniref:hypothetical protein n=1 Tax=Brevibacillus centrosporus TaxID=54910 RepID=UPI003D1D098B